MPTSCTSWSELLSGVVNGILYYFTHATLLALPRGPAYREEEVQYDSSSVPSLGDHGHRRDLEVRRQVAFNLVPVDHLCKPGLDLVVDVLVD